MISQYKDTPHPPGLGSTATPHAYPGIVWVVDWPHAQARVAERSALAAIAPPCGAPQQRHTEPHSGDGGVGGAAP
jgi:hypothetical protein